MPSPISPRRYQPPVTTTGAGGGGRRGGGGRSAARVAVLTNAAAPCQSKDIRTNHDFVLSSGKGTTAPGG